MFHFLSCELAIQDDNQYWTVETQFGQIRGIKKLSLFKESIYYAFKGIPYAQSPTGELRFKVKLFKTIVCI